MISWLFEAEGWKKMIDKAGILSESQRPDTESGVH